LPSVVTVAIPVLNGCRWLPELLVSIGVQQVDHEVELLVCDSGSRDGSRRIARDAGARVLELEPGRFDHARTRNLLLQEARGDFVAMLTQDAQPASDSWLATLLRGFELGDDVALVYGPYLPRPDCPPLEASRLRRFFASLAPDGEPRVDRLTAAELGRHGDAILTPARVGPERAYFTDANGCIRRSAWQTVPYPQVAYAEDHALGLAMLRAGRAKVFMPAAGVLHSHHLAPTQRLRRAFDDYRGLREVYDYREPATIGYVVQQLRGAGGVGARSARAGGKSPSHTVLGTLAAIGEQALQLAGAMLGSRADRLPPAVRRRLSLERRPGFSPVNWDPPTPAGGGDRAQR
jgi:GT2 family glycosyltransferase